MQKQHEAQYTPRRCELTLTGHEWTTVRIALIDLIQKMRERDCPRLATEYDELYEKIAGQTGSVL